MTDIDESCNIIVGIAIIVEEIQDSAARLSQWAYSSRLEILVIGPMVIVLMSQKKAHNLDIHVHLDDGDWRTRCYNLISLALQEANTRSSLVTLADDDNYSPSMHPKWGADTHNGRRITLLVATRFCPCPSLHQPDLSGDSAGCRILPLYQWKSWQNVEVVAQSLVRLTGEDLCPLKQYRFRDRAVCTNSFSHRNGREFCDRMQTRKRLAIGHREPRRF